MGVLARGQALVAPRLAARELARRRAEVRSLDEAAAFPFEFEHRGVRIEPLQKPPELRALLEHVAALEPHTVVEIGTANGGTLFALTQAAAGDAVLVSVEIPEPYGYHPRRAGLYRAFARDRQEIRLLRADSHHDSTLAAVRDALGGRPIDFLLVDGDHRYGGVKRDYEMYAPLVRAGGLVAFHDVVPGPEESVGGVPRFWAELKGGVEVVDELVADWEQGGCGIGLVRA